VFRRKTTLDAHLAVERQAVELDASPSAPHVPGVPRSPQLDPEWVQRCSAAVAELDLPQDFSIAALVDHVADQHGLTIQLCPQEVTDPEISGMSVRFTDNTYGLTYPVVQSAPWWSLMCVGHELGHITRGHLSDPRAASDTPDADQGHDAFADLPSTFSSKGELSRRYRCLVNRPDELEAELFGTLLTRRIERAGAYRPHRLFSTQPERDEPLTANLIQLLG
jgi:hypothetical protein